MAHEHALPKEFAPPSRWGRPRDRGLTSPGGFPATSPCPRSPKTRAIERWTPTDRFSGGPADSLDPRLSEQRVEGATGEAGDGVGLASQNESVADGVPGGIVATAHLRDWILTEAAALGTVRQ